MELRCAQCRAEYELDDARVGPTGVRVKCTSCGHVFRVLRKALVLPEAPAAAVAVQGVAVDRPQGWQMIEPAHVAADNRVAAAPDAGRVFPLQRDPAPAAPAWGELPALRQAFEETFKPAARPRSEPSPTLRDPPPDRDEEDDEDLPRFDFSGARRRRRMALALVALLAGGGVAYGYLRAGHPSLLSDIAGGRFRASGAAMEPATGTGGSGPAPRAPIEESTRRR